MTLHLVHYASEALFPGPAITLTLELVIRNLDFIGASNFWYSMGDVTNPERPFNLSTFYRKTKTSSEITHDALRAMHPTAKQSLLDSYDKSIFTARWTLHVLYAAFGLMLVTEPGGTQDITFTPYNGPDGNRFSWTLGTAVLLASPDLNDLAAPTASIRAPAP